MPPAQAVSSTLFDQAPDGVLLFRVDDQRIEDVNQTFCRMSGYPREQLIGQDIRKLIHPDDLRTTPLSADDMADGAIAVKERRYARADGSWVWCQTTTSRTTLGYLAIVRDNDAMIQDRERLRTLMQLARLRTDLVASLLERRTVLPEILNQAATGLADVIGDVCVIAMVDSQRDLLVPTTFRHRDPLGQEILQATLTRPTPIGTGFAGGVVADGVPARMTDLPRSRVAARVPPQYREYVDRFAVNSMLIVPLRTQDGIIGTLGVARGPAYTEDDEHAVSDLAGVIAAAIEDARHEAELQRATFLLQTVTDALPAMVSYWNRDLRNEFANEAYRQWTGLTAEQISDRHVRDVLGEERYQRFLPYLRGALEGRRQEYERQLEEPSGRVRDVHVTYVPDLRPGGHVAGFVALVVDVTTWTRAVAEFEYQALHDHLTGLANRRALLDHTSLALKQLRRAGGAVAMIFLDLDGFKLVNDSHGHRVGDLVLSAAADRIRDVIRDSDTAARLGGDEFVVLCLVRDRAEAEQIRDRLRDVLEKPIPVDHVGSLCVRASLGVAFAEDADTTSPEQLLTSADEAMFEHKRTRQSQTEPTAAARQAAPGAGVGSGHEKRSPQT